MTMLFQPPFRALDQNAQPVSGAKMYLFAAGTTQPLFFFTDASFSTLHPWPLVADSSGVFPTVYTNASSIKILITTPNGSALPGFPIDNVNPAANLFTLAGGLNTEIAARIAGDASLQNQVNALNNFINLPDPSDLTAATFITAGGTTPRTISGKAGERLSVQDFGAVGDGVADDSAAFTAAAAAVGAGGVIYAPKGRYRLISTVTLLGVFLMGDGPRSTFIDVGTDFSGSSIFKITGNDTGAGLADLSIVGAQPSAPANRAALNTYPVAVDGSGVPRLFFDRVRLAGLTDGFDLTGNTGGTYIGRLELGCIGDALALDGLLDFLHIESIHAWPFGYTTPEQLAAYYDGMNIALRLGKADGLSIDKFAVFRGAVVLEDPSSPLGILPARIGHLQLDGDGSRLVVTNTRVKIDSMYSTKTTAPTATTLEVSGGVVDIGLLSMVGGENGKQIDVTGGSLRIGNGLIEHRRSDIGEAPIQVSGGTLEIENTTFAWPSGTVRDHPMVAQSGTGTLVLRGNRVAAPSATSPVVSVSTDVAGHWIEADRLRPHTFTLPSSLALGRYFGAQNFTPIIVAATPGDLSIAYTNQTGRMRLDGDSYDLLIRLVFTPTFSTASGALTIGGLPFVVSNTSELPAAGFSGLTLSAGRTSCLLRVSASAATLLQSGPMAPLTVAQMASGTPVELFITGRGRL
jgi:hypothetical protein